MKKKKENKKKRERKPDCENASSAEAEKEDVGSSAVGPKVCDGTIAAQQHSS
jgi:hypothetical protein